MLYLKPLNLHDHTWFLYTASIIHSILEWKSSLPQAGSGPSLTTNLLADLPHGWLEWFRKTGVTRQTLWGFSSSEIWSAYRITHTPTGALSASRIDWTQASDNDYCWIFIIHYHLHIAHVNYLVPFTLHTKMIVTLLMFCFLMKFVDDTIITSRTANNCESSYLEEIKPSSWSKGNL